MFQYAARKIEDLPNVNANIKRALVGRAEKKKQKELEEMEVEADAKQMEEELGHHTRNEPPMGR